MNKEKIVYKNKWFQIIKSNKYYFVDEYNSDNGAVILLEEDNKFIFVKIYRPAIKKYSLELPRGYGERNESSKDAAIREVLEETGYKIKKEKLIVLGEIYPNSGILRSKVDVFYGRVKKEDKITYKLNEIKKIIKIKKEKIDFFIKKNLIKDSFSLSALYLYEKKIQRKKDEME